ncbi:hypothetical protein L6452_15776 [Arctium lappa]|uniref:Uncharacterized protein n=1 Tax=Arctium lappa TaxID=4217 RepID=A0ACB9CPH5_ARCLA|nr:hypothetical protein L6452_15776 [Arctium lappa]
MEGLTAEEIASKEPEEDAQVQMTDARCKRCTEKKVRLIEIISAGHADRYQWLSMMNHQEAKTRFQDFRGMDGMDLSFKRSNNIKKQDNSLVIHPPNVFLYLNLKLLEREPLFEDLESLLLM